MGNDPENINPDNNTDDDADVNTEDNAAMQTTDSDADDNAQEAETIGGTLEVKMGR
jgi:hypothetical protein